MIMCVLAVLTNFATVQSEKQVVPDKRPEVASLIQEFERHVEKRGSEDPAAIANVAQLSTEFSKSGPKDKAGIVSTLAKAIESPRAQPKKGEYDDALALAAAKALGPMAPESVSPLTDALGQKETRHDLALQRQLLLALGRTREKDAVKPLTQNLVNPEFSLVAAAAEALGEFEGAKLELRREIFSALIKPLMSAKNAMDDNANSATQAGGGADSTYARRYDAIAAPIMGALHRISKHEETDPILWERWWNKNKNGDWDAKKP